MLIKLNSVLPQTLNGAQLALRNSVSALYRMGNHCSETWIAQRDLKQSWRIQSRRRDCKGEQINNCTPWILGLKTAIWAEKQGVGGTDYLVGVGSEWPPIEAQPVAARKVRLSHLELGGS